MYVQTAPQSESNYNTGNALPNISAIRRAILSMLCNNPDMVAHIRELFCQEIPNNAMEYDPSTFTISFKVKKTDMRKVPGYNMNPDTAVFRLAISAYMKFISKYDRLILLWVQQQYSTPIYMNDVLRTIHSNVSCLLNLIHLQDGSYQVRL